MTGEWTSVGRADYAQVRLGAEILWPACLPSIFVSKDILLEASPLHVTIGHGPETHTTGQVSGVMMAQPRIGSTDGLTNRIRVPFSPESVEVGGRPGASVGYTSVVTARVLKSTGFGLDLHELLQVTIQMSTGVGGKSRC